MAWPKVRFFRSATKALERSLQSRRGAKYQSIKTKYFIFECLNVKLVRISVKKKKIPNALQCTEFSGGGRGGDNSHKEKKTQIQ